MRNVQLNHSNGRITMNVEGEPQVSYPGTENDMAILAASMLNQGYAVSVEAMKQAA